MPVTHRHCRYLLTALLLMACAACASQTPQPPQLPEIPEGFEQFDPNATEGKTDLITDWLTESQGAYQLGVETTGTTGSDATGPKVSFHGYTIAAKAGSKLVLELHGSTWGYAALHRKQSDGSYGDSLVSRWLTAQSGSDFSATITYSVPSSGTLYLVIGSPWTTPYSYRILGSCVAGCASPSYCLEWSVSDGASKQIVVANFDDAETAKARKAEVQLFADDVTLRDGACDQEKIFCSAFVQPVCASILQASPTEHANECMLRSTLRQLAGTEKTIKASMTLGHCAATCTLGGKTHAAGEKFLSPDGCNTCLCSDSGEAFCTEQVCLPG